jgi:hypothetical protein
VYCLQVVTAELTDVILWEVSASTSCLSGDGKFVKLVMNDVISSERFKRMKNRSNEGLVEG